MTCSEILSTQTQLLPFSTDGDPAVLQHLTAQSSLVQPLKAWRNK